MTRRNNLPSEEPEPDEKESVKDAGVVRPEPASASSNGVGNESPDLTTYFVRRARSGDQDAMNRLVRRLTPLVQLMVEFRLRNGGAECSHYVNDVQDIVNGVWMVVLKKLPRLRPRDNRLTPVLVRYLKAVSRNKLHDYFRRPPKSVEAFDEDLTIVRHESSLPPEVRRLVKSELKGEVYQALMSLDSDEREKIVLRFLMNWPIAAIAERFGTKENNLSKDLARILEKLRKKLKGSIFDDDFFN